MLPHSKKNPFSVRLVGTPGEVRTARGQFQYILSKAAISIDGQGNAAENGSSVAQHLRLVREVLDVRRLHFDQLLQRDLDDYRVAEQLIPYLVGQSGPTPPFFPPVLAILLPVVGERGGLREPARAYPAETGRVRVEEYGADWDQFTYESAIRVRHLLDDAGQAMAQFPVAELAWNPDSCELIVLDGQHRAMALLALYRELSGHWPREGERVRMFYRSKLAQMRSELDTCAKVGWSFELPVNIVIPVAGGGIIAGDPLQTARKLFVDVNQSARTMSRGRSLLLSDRVLKGAFLREFLELLRQEDSVLPLYAVDYDEPANGKRSHLRWSVVTELLCLEHAIDIVCFNPNDLATNVAASFNLKESIAAKRAWLSRIVGAKAGLSVAEIEAAVVEDRISDTGGRARPEVVCDDAEVRQRLAVAFAETWGEALRHIIGAVLPVPYHTAALGDLRERLLGSGQPHSLLLQEAIFDGVGLYSVLEAAAEAAKAQQKAEKKITGASYHRSDLELAWGAVESAERELHDARVRGLVGSADIPVAQLWNPAKELFFQSTTHAWQLGLILTLSAVVDHADSDASPLDVAKWLAAALNSSLRSRRAEGPDRRFCLLRGNDAGAKPLNMLGKLDSSLSVHFRYLWLEILLHCDSTLWENWPVQGARDDIEFAVGLARARYREHVIEEHIRELKKIKGTEDKTVEINATKLVDTKLREALQHWFGFSELEFYKWLQDPAFGHRGSAGKAA